MQGHTTGTEAVLSIDALALARCFATADVLAEQYGEENSEYALLGLAAQDNPLRVIATPLLPGQRVTRSSVDQSGHDVLRMRREIGALSARMGLRLVPIAFVHRHPGACDASALDRKFLTGVFIDQVSTAVGWQEMIAIGPGQPPCRCAGMQRRWREAFERGAPRSLPIEHALCFSLIVNRDREHRIYAARAEICPLCGRRSVQQVPARLAPVEALSLSTRQRRALEAEIAKKVVFDRSPAAREAVR